MLKADLAKQYRAKYGDEMPSLKLARIMYADNKLLFKDVEAARKSLRYIEGKSPRTRTERTYPKTPDRPRNPYNLPESDIKQFDPYVIDESKILIMSDIHIPYHDIDALTAIFDYVQEQEIEAVLLNGDILDFYGLS